MNPSPRVPAPHRSPPPSHDPAAATWQNVFFGLSAAMAAFGLVDLDAGRIAGAIGDFGISALMLSLMTEFPLVRLLSQEAQRGRSREDLAKDAERLRAAHPWSQRLRMFGWGALMASLGMRLMGIA